MNKRYLDYANYNIWANNLFINSLLDQDEKLLNQELVGSFPTISETLKHIWFAEMGWLSRLNGNGWETSEVSNFSGDFKNLCSAWHQTSEDFLNFVKAADLEQKLSFTHKAEDYEIPYREIVQTVFNHGSFHRGQVVMMMRQLGITNIPKTDYIEWVRQNS